LALGIKNSIICPEELKKNLKNFRIGHALLAVIAIRCIAT